MNLFDLAVLGIITGGTIFLGLPVAWMNSVSAQTKGRLNAAAVGILLFLLVDVLSEAMHSVEESVIGFFAGTASAQTAVLNAGLMLAGLGFGMLGLVWYEKRFIFRRSAPRMSTARLNLDRAKRMAFMIALGIGFHNFSEGLAIGQSYASGSISLALMLVIGFALHNATEGFGIAAPLSGFKPSLSYMAFLGLVGGGPTFLGTLLGSLWISTGASVFFFALAAGAIIYVVKELLYHGRLYGEGIGQMAFVLFGFLIGFATDLIVVYASGG